MHRFPKNPPNRPPYKSSQVQLLFPHVYGLVGLGAIEHSYAFQHPPLNQHSQQFRQHPPLNPHRQCAGTGHMQSLIESWACAFFIAALDTIPVLVVVAPGLVTGNTVT
jgi:hypothetical protein